MGIISVTDFQLFCSNLIMVKNALFSKNAYLSTIYYVH